MKTIAPTKRKKSVAKYQQFTSVVSYAACLALIGSVVSVGYQSPVAQQEGTLAKNANATTAQQVTSDTPTVDQIVAADLAASVAQTANLSIANNASSLSISMNAKSELAQTDDSLLSKPQIIQSNSERRGVVDYTVVAGDTVPALAQKFGITSQTLRWANRLTSDALTPGRILAVPGTDGLVYTVVSGDTLDSLARKYGVDSQRIVTYNDLEISGVNPGMRIVLPDGVLPTTERPDYVAPRATFSTGGASSVRQTYTTSLVSSGNRYAEGYCTWYAFNRRAELGRPIGSLWGNAVSWASYARAAGFLVDSNPEVGAVLQNGGGYGHVAVVESIGDDGSVTVSEMNYVAWYRTSTRTISPGQVHSYNYIH